jgi:hemerythrin superfamily protein
MPNKSDRAKSAVKGAVKQASQAVRGRTGIYATLSKEHGEVSSLMSELAGTDADETGRRRDLFAKVKTELVAHSKSEDAVLYSALASHPKLRDKIEHSRLEHAEVDQLLDELDDMDIEHQSWMNKFEKLQRSVEHHVHEEENELFPRAREILSADEARSLDDAYEERKADEARRASAA